MRKIIIALSALAAIGIAAPLSSASAQTTVIKHEGERHMDRDHDRRNVKKVIIKRGHRDWDRRHHEARKIVIKHRDRDHDRRKVTIVKSGDRN